MQKKISVNWTIDKDVIELLHQAKGLNSKQVSISKLVSHAVKHTYKNKKEMLREQITKHQNQMLDYRKQLDELEELDNAKQEKLIQQTTKKQ